MEEAPLILCSPNHPDRSTSLDKLLTVIYIRYEQSGRIEDLEKMIVCNREALTPSSCHPGSCQFPRQPCRIAMSGQAGWSFVASRTGATYYRDGNMSADL